MLAIAFLFVHGVQFRRFTRKRTPMTNELHNCLFFWIDKHPNRFITIAVRFHADFLLCRL